jgi:hypothetical protein
MKENSRGSVNLLNERYLPKDDVVCNLPHLVRSISLQNRTLLTCPSSSGKSVRHEFCCCPIPRPRDVVSSESKPIRTDDYFSHLF